MIESTRLNLRGWQDADVDSLLQLRDDIDLQFQLMSQPRPHSPERLRRWLSDKTANSELIFLIIAKKENNQVIGYIQYNHLNLLHRHAELGICIAPEYQKQGFASEAMTHCEQYLMRTFNLRKISLSVLEENHGAIHSYLKNGFVHCGLLKKHLFLDGVEKNVVLMEKFIPVLAGGASS
jgi:RimJ/RimL family protein N-acetyltransferase